MVKRILSLVIIIIAIFTGCSTDKNEILKEEEINKLKSEIDSLKDELEKANAKNDELEKKLEEALNNNAAVRIIGYYEDIIDPNEDSIIIDGLGEGEFVEITVEGTIYNFELVELKWDDEAQELIEVNVLEHINKVTDRKIIIKTYMPEGIPLEKIKWEKANGEKFEHIIQEIGVGNNGQVIKS